MDTQKRDYYELLQVQKSASDDEIKKAYRKAAMKYHPDRTQGNKESEEMFKQCSEAYEVLSDPEKRRVYDTYGHDGVKQSFGQGGFGWQDFHHYNDFSDIFENIGDIFGLDSIFGGGGRRQQSFRGRDIQYQLEISLKEAYTGTEKKLDINTHVSCDKCSGTGAKKGTNRQVCPSCQGTGQQRIQRGFFTLAQTCPQCRGQGSHIPHPCDACRGSGLVAKPKTLSVNIPAGVDTGIRLKLQGEGEAGQKGQPSGDLYVLISVKEHSLFHRQDTELVCEIPISFTQAALGAEIEIPTLDGKSKLKIPAGTQTHKVLVLKGKGMPSLRTSHRGDLHVQVVVQVPRKLNPEQKELLIEFAKLNNEDANPVESKTFFDKIKDVFAD